MDRPVGDRTQERGAVGKAHRAVALRDDHDRGADRGERLGDRQHARALLLLRPPVGCAHRDHAGDCDRHDDNSELQQQELPGEAHAAHEVMLPRAPHVA